MPKLSILIAEDTSLQPISLESLLISIDNQIITQTIEISTLSQKVEGIHADLLVLRPANHPLPILPTLPDDLPVLCLADEQVSGLPPQALCVNPPEPGLLSVLTLAVQNARLQQCLRSQQETFTALRNLLPESLVIFDSQSGRIVEANQHFIELTADGEEQLQKLALKDLFTFDDETWLESARDHEKPFSWIGTCTLRTPQGNRPMQARIAPALNYCRDGRLIFYCKPDEKPAPSVETLRRHRQEAETLREVAATLNHTIDLDQVLNRILKHLKNVIPYDSCSVMLWSEDRLNIFASQGLQSQEQIKLEITGARHIQEVLKTRLPLIIPDTFADDRWILIADDYIRCWLGVPLTVDGRAIGLLSIDKKEPGYYTEQDAELAMAFASQAAVALENARLHERTQRSLQRLSALRKIDMAISASLDLNFTLDILLNQVISQLGVDAADVLLFNPRTLTLDYAAGQGFRTNALQYTHVRLGDGYAGLSALQRQIVNVVDLEQTTTPFPHTILTSSEGFHTYYAAPLVAKGQIKGVLEIFHRAVVHHEKDWMDFLEALGLQAAIAIDNVGMFEELQKSNLELTLSYESTLKGWAQAMELRDRETQGHTQRVTEMAEQLSRRMGIEGEDLAHIRRGAMLHDIGKMGIPDSILLKPGPLSDDEWVVMREHPGYAYQWLSGIPYLKESLAIPYCHHEKWDGSGYPHGLKGEQIPLSARIFAVIDVWDALTSDRPYRDAWPREKALEYIRGEADKHFDPRVVNAFFNIIEEPNDPLGALFRTSQSPEPEMAIAAPPNGNS